MNPNPELNAQVQVVYAGFVKGGVAPTQYPRNTVNLDYILDTLIFGYPLTEDGEDETPSWWEKAIQKGYVMLDEFNTEIQRLGFRPYSHKTLITCGSITDWNYPVRKGAIFDRQSDAFKNKIWKNWI